MALDCIRWHLYQWKIKTATIFNKSLVKAFQVNSRPALYTRSIKRHYIISKIFDNFSISEEYEIQDGDADAAFT